MKYSKGKALLSVFCFILGILFLISGVFLVAGVNMTSKVTKELSGNREDREERCSVRLAQIEEMGDSYSVTYGDETITYTADYADYSIYELTFYVTNQGLEEMYSADPGITVSGEDYFDVYSLWMDGPDYEETPLFYYDSEPYIPAFCTATVKKYVQIKEGVTRLTVSYYPGYEYDSEESFEITL